jgi:small-conductance mechanosensitive channel
LRVTPFLALDLSAISGTTRSLLLAGGIVLAASIVGLVVERVLVSGLRRLAASTSVKFDDIIASSVRGVARWGFFLFGIFSALPVLPLPLEFADEIKFAGRITVLVFAIIVTARFASGVTEHYAHRFLPSSVSLAKIVVNAVVLTIGLLVVFQTLGVEITPILTALGVGGLAVALALQDTLANFFAGIQVLASRQIHTGDYLQLDTGQEGFVHDMGWRSTTIRMLNNNIVIVPNTKLAQAIVTNFSLEERDFSIRMAIGVAYGSDLEQVERVTIEVARAVLARVDGTVKEFDPVVRFHSFGDSSIEFNLIVRCNEYGAQFLLQHELVKALHGRYAAEGIEIPFPIRTVLLRNQGA